MKLGIVGALRNIKIVLFTHGLKSNWKTAFKNNKVEYLNKVRVLECIIIKKKISLSWCFKDNGKLGQLLACAEFWVLCTVNSGMTLA